MGNELVIAPHGESPGGEAYYLGCTMNMTHFMKWVQTLPDGGFEDLRLFGRDFETTKGTEVAVQIGKALEDHPPEVDGLPDFASEIADTFFGLPDGVKAVVES